MEFTEALAKEGKEVVFFIHGMSQQTREMAVSTEAMQTNFDSASPNEVLVVPIDWACADPGLLGNLDQLGLIEYHKDKETNSKRAGSALWKLFSGLKKEEWNGKPLNVIAHSMGCRVLRYVGKEAVEGDASWNEEGLQGKSLLQAAPADLKNHENLFENIFFVAADIPECVFEEPDGKHREQLEHALQSGVAALAVMTKRMHVLHGNGTDGALNQSFLSNPTASRLGSRGPWTDGLLGLGQKSTKVWNKIGDALVDTYEEKDGEENNGNVHVKDCGAWNLKNSPNGHSYQFATEAVDYYLKHMTKGV